MPLFLWLKCNSVFYESKKSYSTIKWSSEYNFVFVLCFLPKLKLLLWIAMMCVVSVLLIIKSPYILGETSLNISMFTFI